MVLREPTPPGFLSFTPRGFFLIRLSGTAPRCVVLELGHLPNSHPQKENGNCGISRGGTTTTFPPTFPSPSAPDCGDSRDTINSATTTCKPLWPPHNSSHTRTHTHNSCDGISIFHPVASVGPKHLAQVPVFDHPSLLGCAPATVKNYIFKTFAERTNPDEQKQKKFHYQVISLAFFSFLHRDGIMHFALAPILQHCFSLRGLFFKHTHLLRDLYDGRRRDF